MLDSTAVNSSANFGTSALAYCTCCHHYGQTQAHWDRADIRLCSPCHHLLFQFEAHGEAVHAAYAFHTRLARGAA